MSKETVKQYIRNQYIGKEQCQFLPQMNQQDSLAHSSLKGCFMAISRCNVHTDPSRIETTQQGSLLFPLILSWTGVWFTGKQVVVEHIFVLHGRVLAVGTLFSFLSEVFHLLTDTVFHQLCLGLCGFKEGKDICILFPVEPDSQALHMSLLVLLIVSGLFLFIQHATNLHKYNNTTST